MNFKKKYTSHYFTTINNIEYSARLNEVSKEWHIYVNDEWSCQADSYKDAKKIIKDKVNE